MNDNLRNYSLEEAADILRCRPGYLEENLKNLPHQKIGKAVAFDDAEIRAIKEMHRVHPDATAPATVTASTAVAAPMQAVTPAVSSLRPSQKHRRRQVG